MTNPPGVQLRRKKPVRGFYFDKDPGFHGLRAGFDAAAQQKRAFTTYGLRPHETTMHKNTNWRGAQTASPLSKRASADILRKVLQKYALLDDQGEPIEAVAKMFAQSNFGYGDDPQTEERLGGPTFGSDMGMPLETGDRNGLSASLSYGGV